MRDLALFSIKNLKIIPREDLLIHKMFKLNLTGNGEMRSEWIFRKQKTYTFRYMLDAGRRNTISLYINFFIPCTL